MVFVFFPYRVFPNWGWGVGQVEIFSTFSCFKICWRPLIFCLSVGLVVASEIIIAGIGKDQNENRWGGIHTTRTHSSSWGSLLWPLQGEGNEQEDKIQHTHPQVVCYYLTANWWAPANVWEGGLSKSLDPTFWGDLRLDQLDVWIYPLLSYLDANRDGKVAHHFASTFEHGVTFRTKPRKIAISFLLIPAEFLFLLFGKCVQRWWTPTSVPNLTRKYLSLVCVKNVV